MDLGRGVSSKSMLASYSGLRFTYSIVPFLSSFPFVACRRSVGQPMLERVRVTGTTTTVRLPERSPGLVFSPARPSRAFTLFTSFATTRPFQVSFVCVFSFEPFRCTGIVSRGLHVFQNIYNHVLSYLSQTTIMHRSSNPIYADAVAPDLDSVDVPAARPSSSDRRPC